MASYVHIGPFGKCCDCGNYTFVRRGSLLGEYESDWTADPELVRLICKGIVRNYKKPKLRKSDYDKAVRTRKPPPSGKRVVCSRCDVRTVHLHWLEPVEGSLVGPLCKKCLLKISQHYSDERGYSIDYPIYITSANKKTLTMARAALMLGKGHIEDCELPHDDEVVLF